MTNLNGLVGVIKSVASSTGADIVATRNIPTAHSVARNLKSAEGIVQQALYDTSKFFRDTKQGDLDKLCINFREVRGKVSGTPMWSSEYDKDGWKPGPDSIVIKRDVLYDKETRGLAESETVDAIRTQAIELVESHFGEFLASLELAPVVPIGAPPLVSLSGKQPDAVAMHSL